MKYQSKKITLTNMAIQQFLSPRIRVTKIDGGRAIIPVDAITGIEEDKRGKCVRINTMDGFSYDVVNKIVEVDKKIDESIKMVNGSVPIVIHDNSQIHIPDIPENVEAYENAKVARSKKKRMLSAGVDKPARRVASLEQGDRSGTPTTPPAFVENKNPEKVEQNDATGDAQKAE